MPVFNGERFLREAIDSILGQTYEDFEFIIVNDGSTDLSRDIVLSYRDDRIVFLDHIDRIGYTTALNAGIEQAQGEFIARQDADDVSLPPRLESQIRFFDDHPEIVLLGSAYHVIAEDGTLIYTSRPPIEDAAIRWQMLFHDAFCHTSVMLRRSVLSQNHLLYDPGWVPAEDYELCSRLLDFGSGANNNQPLVKHRRHPYQISRLASDRQAALATRVSQANLTRLGIDISLNEVETLRQWFHAFPDPLRQKDLPLCNLLLDVLVAHEKQCGIRINQVRRKLVTRMLASVEAGMLSTLLASGLVRRLVLNSPSAVMGHASKRLARRLRKICSYPVEMFSK
jgi:glycosyltransferase involved in cell wall biosynthesis